MLKLAVMSGGRRSTAYDDTRCISMAFCRQRNFNSYCLCSEEGSPSWIKSTPKGMGLSAHSSGVEGGLIATPAASVLS